MKTVGIVSLSRGTIGEDFVSHEVELGIQRLKNFGLKIKFMPNALKGIDYLSKHPESRASDLIEAYKDEEVDIILCAIGGDDTYRLAPYLFDNDELKRVVNNKPFLGFSDTTINHFMLHKLGINTYYGQSFLADICELDKDMLPYTKHYFELFLNNDIKTIVPSEYWYSSRKTYGIEELGIPLKKHLNEGYLLLQGELPIKGKILGGCLDSIFDMFDDTRYKDMPLICQKYDLFPRDWEDKILLIESSEEMMSPIKYEKALNYLKKEGVFNKVRGILVGKPMDNVYFREYQDILVKVVDNKELPILYNINIGHCLPRCVIPFGIEFSVYKDRIIYG